MNVATSLDAGHLLADAIMIDAAQKNARDLWIAARDRGKPVCFHNTAGSLLWEEIKATHRHREIGADMGLVLLQAVRLSDQPDWINDIIERVQPFTLTRPERVAALCGAIEHIVRQDVPGDIVECGVWRGGSIMAAALALMHCGVSRPLWLYDTFEGMPAPQEIDRKVDTGEAASDIMARVNRESAIWCRCSLQEVQNNLNGIGYPGEINYVTGMVEDTLPGLAPANVALLRLDTDWYASTLHELNVLYPRLARNGVLILDDYGHWAGSRRAVDEYFAQAPILLHRIDYSCRVAVKA
jgi:O-methyltransferase